MTIIMLLIGDIKNNDFYFGRGKCIIDGDGKSAVEYLKELGVE